MANDMKVWGHSTVIFKTDQENSMKSIHTEVVRIRAPLRTIPDNSPKGDSQANGKAERGCRTSTEQVRVMILALEEKLDCKLKAAHPIMYWLVEHAGFITTFFQVGRDGKTPYERDKGKKANFELCEFGEQIFYMPLKDKDRMEAGKRAPKYFDGICLGMNEVNGETFIGIPNGVVRTRSILRRPDKWCKEAVQNIVGVPWCLNGDGEDAIPDAIFERRPETMHAISRGQMSQNDRYLG